jgi:predicted RNA-binding Zn-ribbon protein involved in translation (DUF1610 family)
MITEPEPLLLCGKCKVETRLFGIEPYGPERELYTFECPKCGHLEIRTALLRSSWP